MSLLLSAAIAAPFAFRPGVPGLRQDWLWPATRAEFAHWFIAALSTWDPSGFGVAQNSPTVNFVLLFFYALAQLHFPSQLILFTFLVTCFTIAQIGVILLLESVGLELDEFSSWAIAAAYAFGPVMFQKSVAGHLYYVAAYALMPVYAHCCWRACRSKDTVWAALAAGLLLATASAQIQFLFFGAFILIIMLPAARPFWRGPAAAAIILALGLIHNISLLLNTGAGEAAGLIARHATRQWEIDQSSAFSELFRLGGYLHYDTGALPAALHAPYIALKFAFGCFALLGFIAAMVQPRLRAAGVVFGIIALAAILCANGWNGPLRSPLDAAMHRYVWFTLFRELYHFMALYALATAVLAGAFLKTVPPGARHIAALVGLLLGLPFYTMGLPHMIPAIRPADFTANRCSSANLMALLPNEEPVALSTDQQNAGIDLARWLPEDGSTVAAPVAVNAALAEYPGAGGAALGAMGIGCIEWRNGVISRLPASFEPNVGAHYSSFLRREAVLRRAVETPVRLSAMRPELALEPTNDADPLDKFLADDTLPPGAAVGFTYSYENNNIQTEWVSGDMWSWFLPALMNVTGDPVVSKSGAPLPLTIPPGNFSTLYLLAAGDEPSLDGRRPRLIRGVDSGKYQWLAWSLPPGTHTVYFRAVGMAAVARAVASPDANWEPATHPISRSTPVAVELQRISPWAFRLTIPPSPRTEQLVYARRFSRGWTLSSVGPAQRVHGLFNGWEIPPAAYSRTLWLRFAPQRQAFLENGVATGLQFAALLALAIRRRQWARG